jgi:phenylpropionate dioxygenase-like ring-hydroxylating dioxygenase large terminal subunit
MRFDTPQTLHGDHSAWLRDCWYVIAWSHEIPAANNDQLFTRRVLDEPILVYRTQTSELVALQDRCCHRHAPLSIGKREGDAVRCGYHGLKFDATGRCVEMPGIAIAPEKACVPTYPVVEHNNWIFVWMGRPEKADKALLPNNFSCADPAWKHKPGYLHYDTPYLLICDNLLDFSHLSYVHEKTLGGSTVIAQSRPVIEKVDGPSAEWPQTGIRVTRHVPNVPAPPFYQGFRSFDTLLNRWFIYDFVLPGILLMHSGGRPINDAEDDMSQAVQLHSCQALTPESRTSTHYFFQQSHRSEGLDAAGQEHMTESIYQSLVAAFNEDRDMITAQFHNIQHSPAAPMLPLAMDSALVQFRRLLQSRLKLEAQITSPRFSTTTISHLLSEETT